MSELRTKVLELEEALGRQQGLTSNLISRVVENAAQISTASTDANDCQVRLRGTEKLPGYNKQSDCDELSRLIGKHFQDIGCHQKAKTHFSIEMILPRFNSKKKILPIAILKFNNTSFRDAFEREFKS